ncbi:MAG: 3-keto-5-aminohexanoate cleavage protein [Candidatus Margulisiibacteriota bacterium]
MSLNPVLVSVAPNGARKTKADLPNLPITPTELAAEAKACAEAGAILFHAHVREDDQRHSLDPARYAKAFEAIRAEVGDALILQASTETVGIYEPSDQIHLLKTLQPEAASIGIRELIPDPSFNAQAQAFLAWAFDTGIHIQFICYSKEDVHYYAQLCLDGVIPEHSVHFLLFVLGKKTGTFAQVQDLDPFLEALSSFPFEVVWAVCAFGPLELDCMLNAVHHGGHVRIGFENNHQLADGSVAPSTAALVTQFKQALANPLASLSDFGSWF